MQNSQGVNSVDIAITILEFIVWMEVLPDRQILQKPVRFQKSLT